MDSDPSITIAAMPVTIVSKLEHGDLTVTDVQRCVALPLSSEAFTLNASSPNSASSTTSSSMAERFTSPGLVRHSSTLSENDGGDSLSAVSTTAGRRDPEHPLDCGRTSSASNVPSPIIEEGPGLSKNEGGVDYIPEDIDMDVKPSLDEACFSDTCRQDSSSDDMFMSRLDELLQSDTPQDFVAESGLAGVDDLFPSLNNIGQDFSLLDGMNGWSTESLEALPFPEQEVVQAETVTFDGDESAAQMFAQWLRSNAHWISLSDLRKIKLKTSTIDNATRRLGGGKKGLMMFLKLVLVWIQNSQTKHVALAERPQSNGCVSSAMQSRPSTASRHPGTSSMPLEGVSVRDGGPRPFDSSSAMQSQSVHVRTPSEYGSPLPHVAVNSSSCDWAPRAPWAQSPPADHNATVPTSSRFSPTTNGKAGSPLPSTTFGHSNGAWPISGNMLHGAPPSSMSPSLRSPVSGSNSCIGGGGMGDPASMMMLMQQQQCSEANTAATTRAARKSRMERQRWSVRRNRKWAAAAHQSQQRLAAAVPNAGMHTNLPAWPQVVGSAPLNLPYPNSRVCQQRMSSRPGVTECQQNKKPERNLKLLFHKELKQSDVGNLGRIVLPKAAETCLPPLDMRDGVNLLVEDMHSVKVWNMRYRFWPNNKSRMYLLENTGDFVKLYDLKEGDYMMLFRDNLTNRFVIRGAKGTGPVPAVSNGAMTSTENASDAGALWSAAKRRKSLSRDDASSMLVVPTNFEESCDDSSFAELLEQALDDAKESSEAEMCEPFLKPPV